MHPKPNPVVRFIGKVAASRFVTPAAVVSALVLREWPGAARMGLGTLFAAGASQLLKQVVPRRRPDPDTKDPHESFPSGHASTVTPFLLGLAAMCPRPLIAGVIASGGVVAVGASRVDEREHHVSDVVAGIAIGLAMLGTAHVVTQTSSWARLAGKRLARRY